MSGLTSAHCDEDAQLLMAIREACFRHCPSDDVDSVEEDVNRIDSSGSPTPSENGISPRGLLSRKKSIDILNTSKRFTRMVYNTFSSQESAVDEVSDDSRSDDGEESSVSKVCRLRILDARSNISASANALKGAGFESVSRLGGAECTTIKFANIVNIHYVRDSYVSLRSLFTLSDKSQFYARLSESKWLNHISDLLSAAVYICRMLEKGQPVL